MSLPMPTEKDIIEAANACPQAKATLEKLFPTVFKTRPILENAKFEECLTPNAWTLRTKDGDLIFDTTGDNARTNQIKFNLHDFEYEPIWNNGYLCGLKIKRK